MPALPEIPPPRSQEKDALYRTLMENRKNHPPAEQNNRALPESAQKNRNTSPGESPQTKASEGAAPSIDSTDTDRMKSDDAATESKPREPQSNQEKPKGSPNDKSVERNARNIPAATKDQQSKKESREESTNSLANSKDQDDPSNKARKNSESPEPSFLSRDKEQERFQSQKEDIASLLAKDMLDSTKENLKGLSKDRTAKVSTDSKQQQQVDQLLKGIDPVMPRNYRFTAPVYYQGIYLNNYTARTKSRFLPLLKQAKATGINTLVVDVQPRLPTEEFMKTARSMGFYLVSRVVVFEGGLKTYPAPAGHINKVRKRAEESALMGFMEIQLDYIRFADRLHIKGLNLTERYRTIASILRSFEETLRPHGVRIGADIFGRIPFNNNDIIGQKMEVFARYMDTLYPMLYPSHFYGDPFYQKNPYRTIYDGKTRAIKRAGTTRIIAYIQGFTMLVSKSGLSYKDYIKKQLVASKDSGGAGFVVWNPKNDYAVFFQALKETN